jgi:hypothetical protein
VGQSDRPSAIATSTFRPSSPPRALISSTAIISASIMDFSLIIIVAIVVILVRVIQGRRVV